jgi:hypothetical protein
MNDHSVRQYNKQTQITGNHHDFADAGVNCYSIRKGEMKVSRTKFWLIPILLVVTVSIFALRPRQTRHLASLPPVMLWAWERPEKLNFIDTSKVGVAFLAKTILLQGESVYNRPRLQPLELPDATRLVAVVRIETDRKETPTLSESQLETTAAEIKALTSSPNIIAIQIDFDATVSQRDFYRQLLQLVRRDLPAQVAMSITALASWCDGDNWIRDLPIDEAVPMFFRMGVDQRQYQSRLKSGEALFKEPCQNAFGLSLDEPIPAPPGGRVYLFNPAPWTETTVNSALEAYKK